MQTNPSIRFFHGHDLAGLADALACELVRAPLADPLADEVVIVPHPGMGRWIQQRFAQRFGIAACLDLALPARFVWKTLTALDAALPEQSGYERDALRWRIHGLVETLAGTRGFEPVDRYLGDRADPLRAYELADRLADAFDQYLVYRPDWLEAWEQGRLANLGNPHEPWQAALWRAVRESVGEPHRAALISRYGALLANDEPLPPAIALPPRLSVFGVSTLPPIHLRFLAALATRVPVQWYHLDPSDEWWGDVQTGRERRRAEARFARDGVPEAERHLESAHPLLESFGRIGRDFVRQLYDAFEFDDEHVDSAEPASLLGYVRRTLAALTTELPAPAFDGDDSIRVVGCLDPLREVEVLHDALLARFEADPTLKPRDVVIMTPRYADYAPLVEAVFGAAPDAHRLPYTLADRTAAMHPLVHAYGRLLRLPQSRLAASEVLDLLDVPAIARRFGIDLDGRSRLAAWVAETRIRWGLDAADRERAGVGSYEDFSWGAGLDRLLLGYAAGDDEVLLGGVLPYAQLEGQGALPAGAVARFVERLAEFRTRLGATRRPAAWRDMLDALLVEFIDVDEADDAERRAVRAIRDAIARVTDAAIRGGAAASPVAADVMHAALEAELAEPDRRQRFLATGITVCAMVPMRNVPFRVVCLLGLDEGAFPRREPETSFQLMKSAPRPGDRSRSDDDRYLFLEALLAAREHLHLSYRAVNVKDGSSRPPSVVVDELVEFIVARYDEADRKRVREHLVRRMPDAPYELSQYTPGSPSRSFDPGWAGSAASLAQPRRPVPAFAVAQAMVPPPGDPSRDTRQASEVETVSLDELLGFYRNPTRDYARRVLRIVIDDAGGADDDEPFALDGLDRHQLGTRVLERVLRDPDVTDRVLEIDARGAGLLRPGLAGQRDLAEQAASIRTLVAALPERVPMRPVPIDREAGGVRIRGSLRLPGGRAMIVRAGKLRGPDWMQQAIVASLLGQAKVDGYGLEKGELDRGTLDLSRLPSDWLSNAIAHFRASRQAFGHLVAKTSWAYASDDKDAEKAARRCLYPQQGAGGEEIGGEIDDPYVALALRGREPVFDADFVAAATALMKPVADAIE